MCRVRCAGVVMLVKGTAAPGGDFHVRDVRYAGMAPQAALPPPSGTHRGPASPAVPSCEHLEAFVSHQPLVVVSGLTVGPLRRCPSHSTSHLCLSICQHSLTVLAEQPKYVALVSGLGVSETGRDDMMRLSLLVDWLSGMLGGPLDQERASQARHRVAPRLMPLVNLRTSLLGTA